jgi:Reverse transcriptase (RNA-dependent DNA polymerase)
LVEYLNKFVIAYLDNIIIYFNSKEDYYKHVKWVLEQLSKAEIPIVIEKCQFLTKKTNFIGFIIKLGRISIDLRKVKAIVS